METQLRRDAIDLIAKIAAAQKKFAQIRKSDFLTASLLKSSWCREKGRHSKHNDIYDSKGDNVFEDLRLYSVPEVVEKGYCAYTEDNAFVCTEKHNGNKSLMCSYHTNKTEDEKISLEERRRKEEEDHIVSLIVNVVDKYRRGAIQKLPFSVRHGFI